MILPLRRALRTAIKGTVGLIILAILTGLNGCMFYPVRKKDVIGTYQSVLPDGTRGLPDGGTEVLELKPDGTCDQNIALKDGRRFSAQGTWKWDSDKRYFGNAVILKGIYWVVVEEKINPELEKSIGNVVQSFPVGRDFLLGRIILGSTEGPYYEKK